MPDFSDLSESASEPTPTKTALRTELLAARRALPAQTRAEADAALQSALIALIRNRQPAVVAGYAPMPSEPGGADLPAVLAGTPGTARLILPVVRADGELDWAAYAGPGALAPAQYGMREPTGSQLGPDALATAELIVIPALAVDRRGVRLGRGKGHYDRALVHAAAHAYLVAVVYDDELLPLVPDEPHDRRVHAVLTPGGGVRDVS